MRGAGSRPAVFLDRDGVINENVDGDYVRSWDAFRFLPDTREAIARLTSAGIPVVVVSNQQGVGKGLMDASDVEAIHERMLEEMRAAGGEIAAVLYCPHLESEGCECRKPKPGLLTRGAAELGLDLAQSYFVGDAASDVAAARAAGCRPVLVLTGRGREARDALQADGSLGTTDVVADLPAAVDLILG